VLLQDGLQQVGIDPELGRDQAGDAGRPVQQRIAHRAGDLVDRRVGLRDVEQPALVLVQRQALGFHLERQLRDLQPGIGRALGAGASGQGRAVRVGGLDQAAAGLVDVPGAVRLARDPARPLGLAQCCLGQADAAGGLAVDGVSLGMAADLPPRTWSDQAARRATCS